MTIKEIMDIFSEETGENAVELDYILEAEES